MTQLLRQPAGDFQAVVVHNFDGGTTTARWPRLCKSSHFTPQTFAVFWRRQRLGATTASGALFKASIHRRPAARLHMPFAVLAAISSAMDRGKPPRRIP